MHKRRPQIFTAQPPPMSAFLSGSLFLYYIKFCIMCPGLRPFPLGWWMSFMDAPEFLYQSKRFQPKRGQVLIWPGGFTHTHRGNPPLSGEKYIATSWLENINA